MSDTVATYQESDGLEYNYAPEFEFEVGDRILLNETLKLWIDGQLRRVHVLYAEIDSRDRELDVEAAEWYINYSVAYYYPERREITTDSLSQSDIASWTERRTEKSPHELTQEYVYD